LNLPTAFRELAIDFMSCFLFGLHTNIVLPNIRSHNALVVLYLCDSIASNAVGD
jgi:hypothetical protein